jgi:hypothetical protein
MDLNIDNLSLSKKSPIQECASKELDELIEVTFKHILLYLTTIPSQILKRKYQSNLNCEQILSEAGFFIYSKITTNIKAHIELLRQTHDNVNILKIMKDLLYGFLTHIGLIINKIEVYDPTIKNEPSIIGALYLIYSKKTCNEQNILNIMNKLFSELPILPIIEVLETESKIKCPRCTFLNNSSSLECSACENKLIKLCEECLVENKLDAKNCISCKKPFVKTSTNNSNNLSNSNNSSNITKQEKCYFDSCDIISILYKKLPCHHQIAACGEHDGKLMMTKCTEPLCDKIILSLEPIDQVGGNYKIKNKYLKYKQKYLMLKNKLLSYKV